MAEVYTGRFAPSPTGLLHAGSLVAALASWLDARAHGGQWRVRIEDVDTPRCVPGADLAILQQLADCGLVPDGPVMWQSQRYAAYQDALDALVEKGWAYPCGCSRKDIETTLESAQAPSVARHQAAVYPGTCRHGLNGQPARAWRLNVQAVQTALGLPALTPWTDRRLGPQQQNVCEEVGDFVLRRADGLWAYQLAVVVDDAAQGITHVVRGQDLADNTARQRVLQRALGLPTPQYLHTPLVLGVNGEKLSKQNGAVALDLHHPFEALNAAAQALGLPNLPVHTPIDQALNRWTTLHHNTLGAAFATKCSTAAIIEGFAPNLPCPALPMTMPEDTPTAPATNTPATDAAAAKDTPFMRQIKTYVLRAGRMGSGQVRAFEQFGPQFLIPYRAERLHVQAAFGRSAPLILEIGFGMGDATAKIAQVRPGDNFLCCEVHEPGVGALLKRCGEESIGNIRIVQHDAIEVMDHMLGPDSLDGVHIFFPDPWHKSRHHKRRLIQSPFIQRLAQHIKPGGYLHLATDWQPYSEQMMGVLRAEPLLVNTSDAADGFAVKPDYRPLTKFENRGLKLGHGVWDLVFRRV